MNKPTEQKIRQVIREELTQYLIGEGLMNNTSKLLRNAIGFAAMLKAMEPSVIAQDKLNQTTGYQKQTASAVDELGIKDLDLMVKSELGEEQPEILKTIQDTAKVYDRFKNAGIDLGDDFAMKQIEDKIKSNPKNVTDLEKLAYTTSKKLKIAGAAIARNEKLKTLGPLSQELMKTVDPSSEKSLEQIGRDMIANLSKDEHAKEALLNLFVQEINSDLNSIGQAIASGYTPEGELKPTSGIGQEDALKLAAVYANVNDMLPKNQSEFSWVDVDKALLSNKDKLYRIGKVNADEHWNLDAKLPQTVANHKVFTNKELEQWTNEFVDKYGQNMYTSEYKQDGSLKEELRLRKVRQRLNELRGVYV